MFDEVFGLTERKRRRRTIKKNLVMFDYDGVLVDSLDVFATTFIAASHACGYYGIKTHEQVVRLFDGNF